MRYLILSDLHANIEALDEVLRVTSGMGIDKFIVLGDVIDYGPNPNEVIGTLKKLTNLICIRGDHEKGILGELEDEWFSSEALKAVCWTKVNLADDGKEFVKSLPKGPKVIDGLFTIVHGSYIDEDMYLLYESDARENLHAIPTSVCFFGHTHVPCVWSIKKNDGRVKGEIVAGLEGVFHLDENEKYLINPGSVGQPRDGKPMSSFAVYDSENDVVTFQRSSFDYRSTSRKILEIGLDAFTAERLKVGI